jgi:peptidoglycan hydrolase CwlO-like protein
MEVIQMIAIAIGAVGGLIGAYAAFKSIGPNNAKTLVETAMQNMERLEHDADKLSLEVKELRRTVNKLETMVEELQDENERKEVTINALRKELAGLQALVAEFRRVCAVLYGQLLDHGIKPGAEIPE